MPDSRAIQIEGDARHSLMLSGDGNLVFYYITAPLEPEPEPPAPPAIGPNPYRGLEAFTEAESDRFFGRAALTAKLWIALRDLHAAPPDGPPPLRLLPVIGPSGAGKSSAVRAGLMAELARRPLPGRAEARVAVITPGARPLRALALVLARIATGDATPADKTDEFERRLRLAGDSGEWDGLCFLADLLPGIDRRPLIVLVDQFEEAYSLCEDEGDRAAFVATLLHAAADPAGRVTVVAAMRSDFLGATIAHPALNRAIADRGVIVPALGRDELREAIALPAARADHPIDPAVIDRLIEETAGRDGALPLLQFVLTRIWEGMAAGTPAADTVRALGGVGGALAAEAERLYGTLSEPDRLIARRAFLAMVQLGEGARDTRRRVALAAIVARGEAPERVLAVLRVFAAKDARLVTLAAAPGRTDRPAADQTTAEVTHEALFDHWATLQGWLAVARDDLRFHRRLAAAAAEWDAARRPAGLLWRRPALDLLRQFHRRAGHDMTALEEAFWRASEFRQNTRKWVWSGFICTISILAVGLSVSLYMAIKAQETARERLEIAIRSTDFLVVGLAERIAPLAGISASTVRDILQTSESLFDNLVLNAPDSLEARHRQAVMLRTFIDVYMSLGDSTAALQRAQSAVQIMSVSLSRQGRFCKSSVLADRGMVVWAGGIGRGGWPGCWTLRRGSEPRSSASSIWRRCAGRAATPVRTAVDARGGG